MRYCYTNEGFATGSNMVHYAVFADDADRSRFAPTTCGSTPTCSTVPSPETHSTPSLANELFLNPYHDNGLEDLRPESDARLYPIRHYRPTFRLRDLREWKVDYDDEVVRRGAQQRKTGPSPPAQLLGSVSPECSATKRTRPMSKRTIAVVGPTACGKTRRGVLLAVLSTAIVSADSRQVYRGMDVGTGKDLGEYPTAWPCICST